MTTLLMIAAMYATAANATEFYYLSQSQVDYYDGLQATACGMIKSLPTRTERMRVIRHAEAEVSSIAAGAPITETSDVALAITSCHSQTRMAWWVEQGIRAERQARN